jgi:hypothetical protein
MHSVGYQVFENIDSTFKVAKLNSPDVKWNLEENLCLLI